MARNWGLPVVYMRCNVGKDQHNRMDVLIHINTFVKKMIPRMFTDPLIAVIKD